MTQAGAPAAQELAGVRVGLAAVSLSRGGAERQAAQWSAACAIQGADLNILVLEDDPVLRYSLPSDVDVEVAGKRGRLDVARLAARVRAFGRRHDVLVAFQPFMGLLCALARPRVPWLLVAGADPRRWRDTSGVPAAAYRYAFRRAAAAAAPSEGLAACHAELAIRARGPWLVVPNIVPAQAFVSPASDREGVLCVGRLVAEKQPLIALRAAHAAGARITFLGDGPLRARLESEARRLGDGSARFVPFDPAPWRVYAGHRALVLTSRYETFGNVLAESLAAGTPVVSVDCDFGPREILHDAQVSRLVRADETAVAEGLRSILSRPPDGLEAEECRRISERYRLETLAPRVAAALRTALGV